MIPIISNLESKFGEPVTHSYLTKVKTACLASARPSKLALCLTRCNLKLEKIKKDKKLRIIYGRHFIYTVRFNAIDHLLVCFRKTQALKNNVTFEKMQGGNHGNTRTLTNEDQMVLYLFLTCSCGTNGVKIEKISHLMRE